LEWANIKLAGMHCENKNFSTTNGMFCLRCANGSYVCEYPGWWFTSFKKNQNCKFSVRCFE
jgi:hypothetical protein